jgi:hypothetical protein
VPKWILVPDGKDAGQPFKLAPFNAPEDKDPFDKATIKLANPAFGDFQNKREVMGMAEAARRVRRYRRPRRTSR